ncbi:radiation-inducible immediate-early gene IEX-1 [Periophthalmus magnuspinnatus]|uniref:radiation-inducible immediate-early gene IEX-1 n=1 Tax=Periophthalmus magnuspinnatus TaxID=409849 RepID=UPI00145AD146|nr:radiation-inducible immediate-early gene IEX-1 [Periophthalmus magnuspinnatus]
METLTLTQRRERYAECRWTARSTEPEVFTFERIPPQTAALSYYAPIRPKKRCTRVMYPAKVRMHLPPPERSAAKRALLMLLLVLLWQIWTEEPELKTSPRAPQPTCPSYVPVYFTSRQQSPVCPARSAGPAHEPGHSFEGARNSYVVALLVAHRLGSD